MLASACGSAPPLAPGLDGETGGAEPQAGSLHDFMMANLRQPTGHVTVTRAGAEGALVAQTRAGRRAVVDLSMGWSDDSLRAELWVAGARVQVVEGGASTPASGLEPREERVLAAALVALARRFAANECVECCERALAAARAAAPEVESLAVCGSGEGSCCE